MFIFECVDIAPVRRLRCVPIHFIFIHSFMAWMFYKPMLRLWMKALEYICILSVKCSLKPDRKLCTAIGEFLSPKVHKPNSRQISLFSPPLLCNIILSNWLPISLYFKKRVYALTRISPFFYSYYLYMYVILRFRLHGRYIARKICH